MKVSFVIPTFNSAAWLPHAVKSCQDQTHKDIEIVIIDDCSTDTTSDYIEWLLKQGDSRIVYHRNEKNMGRSYSRNFGNKIALGDICAVLDSDDLAVKTRAEWTLKKMKSSKTKICFGSAVVMDALGNALNEIQAKPINLEDCLKNKQNGIVHSTLAYTKEMALKYPYAEGEVATLGIDDWDQQLRMMVDGHEFSFVPDVICAYRIHGEAITQTRNQADVDKLKDKILEGLKCKI